MLQSFPFIKLCHLFNAVQYFLSGNGRFMNGLSKRNSGHLRMTHVQFVHVHFLTPTPLRSFSSFISFSSFPSFRSVHFVHFVHFVQFILFISFIFSKVSDSMIVVLLKWHFCTSFHFLNNHITFPWI